MSVGAQDIVGALQRERGDEPHTAGSVELIETHISWVFLVAERAFKVKKPLDLSFLDFSTLESRRFFCEEEVRLNRRTAPDVYLGVVPIVEAADGLRLGGSGRPVEYAVEMRRFPQAALADSLARAGQLGRRHMDAIAGAVASFHASLPPAIAESSFGTPESVVRPALQNFEQLDDLLPGGARTSGLAELLDWTHHESARLREVFAARKRGGFVRECHGDLHLRNIVFLDGRPTPFDCIEFDPELRWIDVMNEVAFLVMDLVEHKLDALAWRCLSAYLEATGDYDGVRVLRFYLVYRAMVRAKIARVRAAESPEASEECRRACLEYDDYVALARSLASSSRPAIVLMHGLSGSGKTTVAQRLVERLRAVRVRSDIERKRLHGMAAGARTRAALDEGIYAPESTRLTYDRLEAVARDVVGSGYRVIVDAAFLARTERARFAALAGELGAPFVIVSCVAPEELLRERLTRRSAETADASEAGVAVLEHQLAGQEPLAAGELMQTVRVQAEWGDERLDRAMDEIEHRLSDQAGSGGVVARTP